jgi:hypothetical protein
VRNVFSVVPTGTVPPWLKVIVDLGSARNELGPQRHNSLWQRCPLPRVCQAIVRLLELRPLVRVTGGGCRRKWLFREDSTLQGPPEPPSTMADIWKSARSSFASAPQAELWANLSASEATYLLLVQRATQPLSLVRIALLVTICRERSRSVGQDTGIRLATKFLDLGRCNEAQLIWSTLEGAGLVSKSQVCSCTCPRSRAAVSTADLACRKRRRDWSCFPGASMTRHRFALRCSSSGRGSAWPCLLCRPSSTDCQWIHHSLRHRRALRSSATQSKTAVLSAAQRSRSKAARQDACSEMRR